MFSNRLYSPMRYPGGKARYAPFIAELMRRNGYETGHYFEPYAGGAGVALELLFHGHATHVHINDLDPAVHAFWVAVTQYPTDLLNLLRKTPVTMLQRQRWRAVMRGEQPGDPVERGFATLFMNRTNRSGILKGGVIGGNAQKGKDKIDARFNKEAIALRIEVIAQHAHNISVYCEDAYALLRSVTDFLPRKSLIYLDPPYYVKGRGLYRNFYRHTDHLTIAQLLQSRAFKPAWVVSYDNVPEISAMYRGNRRLVYSLHYSAQERYVGDEVMFFRPGISVPTSRIPPTSSPASRRRDRAKYGQSSV